MAAVNLNLGCGKFPEPGFVNVDKVKGEGVDLAVDLEETPWPWEDGTVRLVKAYHVLEHMSDPYRFMGECHRILKVGCMLKVKVPHYSCRSSFEHPDHKRHFALYFANWFPGWDLVDARLNYSATNGNYIPKLWDDIFNIIAMMMPRFCDRYLCHWVGGYEEIECLLIKKPNEEREDKDATNI